MIERTGTVIQSNELPNVTTRVGNRELYRYDWLAVPSPAVAGRPANRMPATESGESLPRNIADPQAAPPVALHALRLGDGEQRIRHESVIAEYGEVVPRAHVGIVLLAGAA